MAPSVVALVLTGLMVLCNFWRLIHSVSRSATIEMSHPSKSRRGREFAKRPPHRDKNKWDARGCSVDRNVTAVPTAPAYSLSPRRSHALDQLSSLVSELFCFHRVLTIHNILSQSFNSICWSPLGTFFCYVRASRKSPM